ncbi:MAG TPA: hypothetical protein VLR26_17870 [Frankiaceae bacterium]|nr:hypothetical protein [Frankiaceae bacterium]
MTAHYSELSHAGLTHSGARIGCGEEPTCAHSGAIQPHGFLLGVDPASDRITASRSGSTCSAKRFRQLAALGIEHLYVAVKAPEPRIDVLDR